MGQLVIGALRVDLAMDTAAFTEGANVAQRELDRMAREMRKTGAQMQNIGKNMTIGLTLPIVAFGASAVKVAGDFEQSMNRVAAVSGATGQELEQLRDLAKEMGRTTQFTASDAADALGFLAMAGFDANESMAALPGTLTLAASAQMDMARAADIVSNVLSGYGMEVNELARVNDVLVAAFTKSNTNLEQLGEAMKYAGPVASAAGVSFEEATAALGLMGNAGIQASMAGTSLRGAISRILAPTNKMSGIMDEMGLNFTDAAGRLLPLADIIRQLEPHAEDAGLFMELFGQRAGPAMAALVSQGSGALQELTGELENSGGTAQRISDVQMQGFNGAMKKLQSAFEGLQIAVAESGLLDTLANFVSRLADGIQRMGEASPATLRLATAFALVAAAIGPVLVVVGSAMQVLAPLISTLSALGSAATAAAAASGVAGTGFTVFAAGIKALAVSALSALAPFLPIIAAVAAVGLVIYANWDKIAPVLENLRAKFVEVLGPKIQKLIDTVMGALTELWEGPLGDDIRVVMDVLGQLLAVFIEVYGEYLIRLVGAAVEFLTGAFNTIVNLVKFVAAVLNGDWAGAWQAAKDFVTDSVSAIIGIAESLVPGITQAVTDLYNGVKLWIQDRLGGIFTWLGDKLHEAERAFFGLYDAVVGNSHIPDMVDGVISHMRRLDAGMVGQAKKVTSETEKAFRELADRLAPLMDRLFPDAVRVREYRDALKTIEDGLAAGQITPDLADEMYRRAGRVLRGVDVEGRERQDLKVITTESLLPSESEMREVMDRLTKEVQEGMVDPMKDKLAETLENWRTMTEGILTATRDMVNSFRSGDILGGIMGVLNLVGQIAGAIAGITGKSNPFQVLAGFGQSGFGFGGGRAMGGPVMPGMAYRVGERGPEYFVPGTRGTIVPANGGKGGGGNTYHISGNLLTPEFWAEIQRMDDVAALRGATGGAQLAEERRFEGAQRRIPQ